MSLTVQPTARAERGAVRLGTLTLGAGPAVVIGGPGADARWIDLRERRERPGTVAETLAGVRARWAGPVLVEPSSAGDLPQIAAAADGVVVGAAWTRDLRLVRAVSRLGLPVVVQRGPATSCRSGWPSPTTAPPTPATGSCSARAVDAGGRARRRPLPTWP
ncbi:hypothetical protein [Planomonospora algeriensis]